MEKTLEKSNPGASRSDEKLSMRTDSAGVLRSASTHLLSLLEKAEEDLIGQSISRFAFIHNHLDFFNALGKGFRGTRRIQMKVPGKASSPEKIIHFLVFPDSQETPDAAQEFLWIGTVPDYDSTDPASPGRLLDTLDQLYASSPVATFVCASGDWSILYANSAAVQTYGYSLSRLHLLKWPDLFETQACASLLSRIKTGTDPYFRDETDLQIGSLGQLLKVRWSANPVQLGASRVYVVFAEQMLTSLVSLPENSLENGSEGTQIRQAPREDDWQRLLTSLDDIVFEFDLDDRFVGVWCRDESLLLYKPGDILGRRMKEVFADRPELQQMMQEDFDFVKSRGADSIREYSLFLNNETRWFQAKISPIFSSRGKLTGLSQRISEITEQKKVEMALAQKNQEIRKAHRELAEIIDNSTEIIYKLDQEGRFVFLSPEFQRSFGYEEAELIGKSYLDLVHPEEINESWTRFLDCRNGQGPVHDQILRVRRKDGSYGWISASSHFIAQPYGEAAYMLGFAKDITELMQTNRSLASAEDRYRVFVQQSSEGIWRFEAGNPLPLDQHPEEICRQFMEGAFLAECNDAFARMYGYEKAADMAGMPLQKLIPTDDPVVRGFFLSFIESGFRLKDAETVELDKEGHRKYFLNNLIGIIENGSLIRVWGIQRDITQQKQAQNALRESELRFRQLAETAPVMIWVSDAQDHTTYVNSRWIDFTGYSSENFTLQAWKSLIHPDDRESIYQYYQEGFASHQPVIMEYRLRSKNDGYRWVLDQGVPRFLDDGTFWGYVGTVLDIDERKQAEEKIKYQAQVLQNISDIVLSTDLAGRILTWNKAAEKIFGYREAEVQGRLVTELPELNKFSAIIRQATAASETLVEWEGEINLLGKDGRQRFLHSTLTFVRNERNEKLGIVGILRDITDRKKSERDLRISEERYRSLVDALGEGILLYDRRGIIIAANQSALRILGSTESEIIGRNYIYPASGCVREDGSAFPISEQPVLQTLLSGQSYQSVVLGIRRPDGPLTWLSINTEPIFYSLNKNRPDAVVASLVDITEKKAAALELIRSEKQLREYSARIMGILDSITDGFIVLDKELNVVLWNPVVERLTKIKAGQAMGQNINRLFPGLSSDIHYFQHLETLEEKGKLVLEHYDRIRKTWFEMSAFASGQGLFVYFRDITERKIQEDFLQLEKQVLEMNAKQTNSLKATVDFLLEELERLLPDFNCSVLMLEEDRQKVRHLSAPSLDESYIQAIDHLEIGPAAGSCGTAMFRKEEVIVENLQKSTLWANYLSIVEPYGFRACWSFPVLDANQEVLASFATYFREPRQASPSEKGFCYRIVNLLRVIIENKRYEKLLKQSNERYLLATMATNDAIWDWDLETNNLYWGEGFYGLFGYRPGNYAENLNLWEKQIHPLDRTRVINSLNKFRHERQAQLWEEEYRFLRSDGKYVLVYDRGFMIYDQFGKPSRMVGAIQDITEKRELERRLLKQELDRQKLIAQAVVDAQEKERALIGKELHDNVNQILSTAKLYLELASADAKDAKHLMGVSAESISNAINEIRSISRSLVPSSIDDLGLIDAVKELAESLKATGKIDVEFHHRGDIDARIDQQLKLMLYRISQEQVSNILKHSGASQVIIELVVEENSMHLSIRDNGKGFDYPVAKGRKGIGLSNMASRAELLNGKIDMVTALGKGCALHVTVPIHHA